MTFLQTWCYLSTNVKVYQDDCKEDKCFWYVTAFLKLRCNKPLCVNVFNDDCDFDYIQCKYYNIKAFKHFKESWKWYLLCFKTLNWSTYFQWWLKYGLSIITTSTPESSTYVEYARHIAIRIFTKDISYVTSFGL